jgi:hypothetical protein
MSGTTQRRSTLKRRAALLTLGAAIVMLVAASAAGAALAATSFTGGADDYPIYIPNDHTIVAIHISATGVYGVDPNALLPSTQYNVKLRLNTSPTPSGSSNRGWTYSGSATNKWVQERDPSWNTPPCDFPVVTTDPSGLISGSNGWFYFKFGDTAKSGTYYIIASLQPVGSTGGTTINGTLAPAVTIVDMASSGFWMHNGVATGAGTAKRAEVDLDGTSTVAGLEKTETNLVDDDSNGTFDDEDYGPSGKSGDFLLAGPTSQVFDVYLSSHTAWTPGANVSSGIADVDIAVGATDTTPPTAPSGLTVAPRNAGAYLSWTAATDAVGVTRYSVYRWTDPTPIGGSTNYTSVHAKVASVTSGTTYTDSGLTNGTKYYYEVRAADAATNVGPRSGTVFTTPDGTAPVTSISGVDALWHTTDVTATLSATDNSSGVATTEYAIGSDPFTAGTSVLVGAPIDHSNDGAHTVTYRSTDNAGNVESDQTWTVYIDTTAPVTAHDVAAAGSARLVTFSPVDGGSGMVDGLAATEYRIDGGDWVVGTAVTLRPLIRHKRGGLSRGNHLVEFRSTDNAGNVESIQDFTVRLGG